MHFVDQNVVVLINILVGSKKFLALVLARIERSHNTP